MGKEKKQSAADVIRTGITKGFSVEKILKLTKEKVPTSNADKSHIVYYANALFKKDEIDEARHAKYVEAKKDKPAKKEKPVKKEKTDSPKEKLKRKLAKKK